MRQALLFLLVLPLAGCFADTNSASDRLGDAVYGLVNAVRWGRADLATELVDPGFRARFIAAHAAWGDRITVADCDVETMEIARNERRASAIVAVSWYGPDSELHLTRVAQEWKAVDRAYMLTRETVLSGDDSLLARAETAAH